ncbi:TPA: hypothetical protein L4R02_001244 [Pseudomonas aeruginosa]|nr:hypothetical protein [Pseudomonas aeruginosa]
MFSLEPYRLTLEKAPARVLKAISEGVKKGSVPSSNEAMRVLGGERPPMDGVIRDPDGRVLVTCVTDMPGVTPTMIDWWFGWHMPNSERYALWHPLAHIRAHAAEDRSRLADDRAKYIGNVSYVDEFIGASLKKLAIAFVPPGLFNLHDLDARRATAVCAFTTDRILNSEGGCLIHYVIAIPNGAQMRSGFWMGDIRNHNKWVDWLSRGVLNRPFMRHLFIKDRMALDLLQHCAEEMNHLARFLPALYSNVVEKVS